MTKMQGVIAAVVAVILGAAGLSVRAQQQQQQAAQQLYVVTYVDVYPNFAADGAKFLQQFAADSRKDPGSVRFEVMKDTARQNHMAIVEVWRDRKAFEAHLAAPHTKAVREKIQQMLGSPFDERLYNLLP
jgi:quinol monooxygenase YgiN